MRAKTKLKPGQDGAKSLLDSYGGQLLCLRYRYGEALAASAVALSTAKKSHARFLGE